MSEPTQPSEESIPERPERNQPDTQSPGEILRESRLAHDWSIDDLCAETKLSGKSVNALENNAFNELSQPIFAGGYYRQCAKVLDIDSERMMAAYAAWGGQKTSAQTAAPVTMDVVPEDVTPPNWRVFAAIGAIVLLVIVGAIFVFMPNTNSDDSATAEADNSDTAGVMTDGQAASDTGNATVGSGNSSATSNGRPAGSASQDTDTSLRVSPEPSSGADTNTGRRSGGRNVNDTLGIDREAERRRREAETAPEPQVEPNHLVVTFTDRSWVDIRDAGDSRLLRGIFEAGDTHEFDAAAPYRITLGYAPGVDMTIGGQDVDIKSQTSSNSTARLSVEARDDGNE